MERSSTTVETLVPEVSVVITLHNGAKYIDATLRSVRSQSLTNIEIIVVDDESRDGGLSVVENHAREDKRIHIIRQPHSGVAIARNTGIQQARGRWIAILDQDDEYVTQKLEKQVQFLKANPDVRVLGTNGWRIGSANKELGVFDIGPKHREDFKLMRSRNEIIYLLASSVIFCRELALELGGFSPEPGGTEDVDLWTRMSDENIILTLPERLTKYRVHNFSLSAKNLIVQKQNTLRIIENARLRRMNLPEMSALEFSKTLSQDPFLVKVNRHRVWYSQYYYRMAGGLLADRKAWGVIWLLLSFLLAPAIPICRIKDQVVPWYKTKLLSTHET